MEMLNEDTMDILEDLESKGLVHYNGNDQAVKVEANRHLRSAEICAVMLPLVLSDIRISNRELARITGFDPRTVGKHRGSEEFLKQLAHFVNKKMVGIRALALEELEKLLLDTKLNPNTKVKGITLALSHSERMAEIAMSSKIDKPVDVTALLKELENF